MGYATVVQQEVPSYLLSNNILGTVYGSAASNVAWHKAVELLRLTPMYTISDIRVQYRITIGVAHTAHGKIYRNGVALGADTGVMNAAGSPYTFVEDFNLTDARQGDTIELWFQDNVAVSSDICDYLRVCGDPVTWR
jgi:hypothetical protein